ncbi:MAG TPA: glucose-6-phosphate isomerase [Planctomycetaceae bacterium]|nr:glucose-6-phosphate isomerase [Planctomycetaceae bacterium]
MAQAEFVAQESSKVRLTERPQWKALSEHQRVIEAVHLRVLLGVDEPQQPLEPASHFQRPRRYVLQLDDLVLDYSKNRVTDRTIDLLVDLAEAVQLRKAIEQMFAGQRINVFEDRAAAHVALRGPRGKPVQVEGRDVSRARDRVLKRMKELAQQLRHGRRVGATGQKILNVVNIGIGGSHLGPAMACRALTPYCHPALTVRFVSNVDGSDFADTVQDLRPQQTLFIVSSKTFNTLETMANAQAARQWVVDELGEDAVAKHFVAVSTNPEGVRQFGIVNDENIYEFWDWVGGRYSLCSAIGLPLIIAIGPENFRQMLAGFNRMDEHFRQGAASKEQLKKTMPVILGLLGVWYNNFFGWPTHAILPYAQHLNLLPEYLQQLDMESNGKSYTLAGEAIAQEEKGWQTGPIIWGQPGTNGQHAFYQLLHQGTKIVPADFIGFARPHHQVGDRTDKLGDHHDKLIANLIAQSEALAIGNTIQEAERSVCRWAEKNGRSLDAEQLQWMRQSRYFPGNRPSNVILADRLDPATLGKLIALYEHKVFVQGVIWGVPSFDQWGVELGKELASRAIEDIKNTGRPPQHDMSTNALIHWHQQRRA